MSSNASVDLSKYLTPQELALVSEVRQELQSDFEKLPENVRDRYHDEKLVRFLRARNWDKPKALTMLRNNMKWRIENDVETIIHELPKTRHGYEGIKYWVGRFHKVDKRGLPVWTERLGLLDAKSVLKNLTFKESIECHIFIMEVGERILEDACLKQGLPRFVGNVTIEDATGLKSSARQALDMFKKTSAIDQENYPEMMHKFFVINQPAVLTMLYSLIKPFIDANTKKKIIFCGKNWKQQVAEEVPLENLPRYLTQPTKQQQFETQCDQKHCLSKEDGCVPPGGPFPQLGTERTPPTDEEVKQLLDDFVHCWSRDGQRFEVFK